MITVFCVADSHAQASLMAQTFETYPNPWQEKEFFDQAEFGRIGEKFVVMVTTDETFTDYALNAMQFMHRMFGFKLSMKRVAPDVIRILYEGRAN